MLLALEEAADYKDGTNARPGVVDLARKCSVSVRLVSSALDKARRLRFIEQTARHNPKRHIAATYRLISTCSSVHVESNGSTCSSVHVESAAEPDFNVQKPDFNVQNNGVSTCSTLHLSIPITPKPVFPEGALLTKRNARETREAPTESDEHPHGCPSTENHSHPANDEPTLAFDYGRTAHREPPRRLPTKVQQMLEDSMRRGEQLRAQEAQNRGQAS